MTTEQRVAHTFAQRGERHFRAARYEDARDAYLAAYTAAPSAELLFRIAQCQRMLGEGEAALRSYRDYLDQAPMGPHAEESRAHVAALTAVATPVPPPATRAPEPQQERENEEIAQARARALQLEREGVEPRPSGSSERQSESPPVYKRWWFWTAIGGVAVAGLAIGLGVGLTRDKAPGFSPTLPSFGSETMATPKMMQLRF